MMNEHNLDRLIDAAADAMITREPGPSLGYTVMARVREADEPAPRRFGWLTAAASLVVCAAIAMTVFSRTPPASVPLPRAAKLIVGQPVVMPTAPVAIASEATPARRTFQMARVGSGVPTRVPLALSDASPIDAIHTEPIVLSALELPPLERETTAIDALNIEPLTIEPLAASND